MKTVQTTLSAGRLSNEVTPLKAIVRWLQSPSSLCSSLMEEQVTHLQVISALATFIFITLAVFTFQRDLLVTVLFIALAAFCRRGIGQESSEN